MFLNHPWGLRDNIRCSFWAHCKVHSGLLLMLIKLFSLAVTAEALQAKIYRKSVISLQRSHFDLKFQVEGDVPTNIFCMDS